MDKEASVNKLLTLPVGLHATLVKVADVRDAAVSSLIRTAVEYWLAHGAPVKGIEDIVKEDPAA